MALITKENYLVYFKKNHNFFSYAKACQSYLLILCAYYNYDFTHEIPDFPYELHATIQLIKQKAIYKIRKCMFNYGITQ